MGVTITADLAPGLSWTLDTESGYGDYDWCLCAQGAPEPHQLIHTASGRVVLRLFAYEGCTACGGSGICPDELDHRPVVLWNEGNAPIMFRLLGLRVDGDRASLPEMRRAIIRARSLLHTHGPELARPAERLQSSTGVAFRVGGLDVAGMAQRLDELEALVAEAAAFGAPSISWS